MLAQIVRSTHRKAGSEPVLGDDIGPVALPPCLRRWKDRADVLAGECGGAVTWTCRHAGTPWSSWRPGDMGARGVRPTPSR
jgi:hypothetical protein